MKSKFVVPALASRCRAKVKQAVRRRTVFSVSEYVDVQWAAGYIPYQWDTPLFYSRLNPDPIVQMILANLEQAAIQAERQAK
jgi:hypothetical protein